MEETSFFELPLDKELYKPKVFAPQPKKPIRVLVTDAGGKIAYNLIYHICSGFVFGHDQEIILHLINSRGSINHKSILLELEECGFAAYKDFVVSSNPAIAYRKVDVVIAIATFEELAGRPITSALIYQISKARQVAKYAQEFAKKDVKIIFTGPSTKALVVLLGSFKKFSLRIPDENISCMVYLDIVISKAVLAAKLKTITTRIKNVIIWSATYPDVHNATVHMYPPNDFGALEMKDIPLAEALQDDHWLFSTFGLAIYRRAVSPDLLKYGKAVAQATVHHLKILFQGSDKFDEISSMGLIAPETYPYGVPGKFGFSFPVKTENGCWEILKKIKTDVTTRLNLARVVFNLTHGEQLNSFIKILAFMADYEGFRKQIEKFNAKKFMDDAIELRRWTTKYFVTYNRAEGVSKFLKGRFRTSRKSILWDDELSLNNKKGPSMKSSIRFSSENFKLEKRDSKGSLRKGSILVNPTDVSIWAKNKATNENLTLK